MESSESSLAEQLEEAVAVASGLDAPLSQRLASVADRVREISPDFSDEVDQFVARLKRAEVEENSPQVADTLPTFLLPDQAGKLQSLERLTSAGPVAVVFLRGHWCVYCRLVLDALTSIQDDVAAMDATLVAVTPETREYTRQFADQAGARFPILTDIDNAYALNVGIGIWIASPMAELLDQAGWHFSSYQKNAARMLPVPATFVVDSSRRVVARYVDPDYRRRMEIQDLVSGISLALGS